MYYIPAGIFAAQNDAYVAKAQDLYGITSEQIESLCVSGFVNNLFPVTIGNIAGGMFFVGLIFFLIHKSKRINNQK